jgi:hypothetical protein
MRPNDGILEPNESAGLDLLSRQFHTKALFRQTLNRCDTNLATPLFFDPGHYIDREFLYESLPHKSPTGADILPSLNYKPTSVMVIVTLGAQTNKIGCLVISAGGLVLDMMRFKTGCSSTDRAAVNNCFGRVCRPMWCDPSRKLLANHGRTVQIIRWQIQCATDFKTIQSRAGTGFQTTIINKLVRGRVIMYTKVKGFD